MEASVPEFRVPERFDMLGFFGAEPVEQSIEDGYWCYEVADSRGIKLRFSFNLFEASVQTELSLDEGVFETVSHELAEFLRIDGEQLKCEFAGANSKTLLVIRIAPSISVRWSTLRTQ